MCLYIEPIKHSYKTETINGEQLIPVWKILKKGTNQSPMFPHAWKKGWNKSNRQSHMQKRQFDGYTYLCDKIYRGFHFYLTKKRAELDMKNAAGSNALTNCKVVKMYVRKNDIIAKGVSHIVFKSGEVATLAAMKAYWKG